MSKQDKYAQRNNRPAARPERQKFEDDRTPIVKRIDMVCRFLAVFLAVACMIDLHIIVRGGGYDYETPAAVLGYTVTNLETDQMEPEIASQSAVFLKIESDYQKGDLVFYDLQGKKGAGKIVNAAADGETLSVQGSKETQTIEIPTEDIGGKIIGHSHRLYGFFKHYMSTIGVALSIMICFILILIPDILMFKKRKAAAEAKRAAYQKRQERKLKVKQGKEEARTCADPAQAVKERRQEKIDKDKKEIEQEMKLIQEKMKEEEDELNLGGKESC